MTDTAAEMAALFQQLHKLFKALPDQAGALVSGSSKLVVLGPDQEVIDYQPGLKKALLFVRRLTPEEAAQIDGGQASIKLVRKGGRCAARNVRSAQANRIFSPCRCRSRTAIWCRSARISASCHGHSSAAAGAARGRWSRRGKPVGTAQSGIIAQSSGLGGQGGSRAEMTEPPEGVSVTRRPGVAFAGLGVARRGLHRR